MLQKRWICFSPDLSYVLISPFEILPYHNCVSFTPRSLVTHVSLLLIYIHPPNKCWTPKTLCALVQLLSHVQLFVTPWIAIHQARLSSNVSGSLLKYMFIELVMLSKHLILCHSFLPLPSIFPSIRVFSNELALHIRWPKYRSFSFSISPSNEYSELISFRIDWFDLCSQRDS